MEVRKCTVSCPLRKSPPSNQALRSCWSDLDTSQLDLKAKAETLYEPLRPWQTRIIELMPGQEFEPLRCKLLTVEFVDMEGVGVSGTERIVTYDALSYSWGSPDMTATIFCNDLPWPVRPNLATALQYLRHQGTSRHLWCDAICINQRDTEEKAQQVRNILRVFEKAKQVIAWIGAPECVVPPTIDEKSWNLTAALFDALKDKSLVDSMSGDDFSAEGPHSDSCRQSADLLYSALMEHLRRPWFSRTWVRQEVFAAQEMIVQCGSETLLYSDLVRQTKRLADSWTRRNFWARNKPENPLILKSRNRLLIKTRTHRLPSKTFDTLGKDFRHAGTDQHDYEPPKDRLRHSLHWLRTLNDGTAFNVTDPRDRIYGVVGMIQSQTCRRYVEDQPEIRQARFPINYSKTVSEVFQDVVKFLINTDRNLDILTIFEDRRNRADDLPSWVPDWRQNINRVFLVSSPDRGKESKHFGLASMQDFEDQGKLKLVGRKVGVLGILNAIDQSSKVILDVPRPSQMTENFQTIVYEFDTYISGSLGHSKRYFASALSMAKDMRVRVPRHAMIDDAVVAFESGQCLFLLRPLKTEEFEFLGPVCGDASITYLANSTTFSALSQEFVIV